jgi:curved DNA-binding protein CbpA
MEMRVSGQTTAAHQKIPRLRPGVDLARLAASPAEGYLLSRIDGRTSWLQLRAMGGLSPQAVDDCLERWLAMGALEVGVPAGQTAAGPAPAAGSAARPRPEPASPPPGTSPAQAVRSSPPASDDIDPTLDIPVAVQEQILVFEGLLDRPYHEILGVAPDADRKALRKAYFGLSRQLHPDRFFRRNTGPFGKRLERIFGRIVEAYELLSDPMARAEIERSLAAAAGVSMPAPGTPGAAASAAQAAAPPPEEARVEAPPAAARRTRRPHVFSLHSRLVRERRARAKRLFEAAMGAFAHERWLEAAAGVRLAIAFDPWNAIYKEQFGEVQRRAHEERARQLVKEAEVALELRDFAGALRAFEEALGYRPHDGSLLHRAARLAWAAGGDLHQAKEWAIAAVELEPQNGAHHRVLGQIYKAAGLEANARRELEAALALDSNDEEARAELRGASGRLGGLRWLGGKR